MTETTVTGTTGAATSVTTRRTAPAVVSVSVSGEVSVAAAGELRHALVGAILRQGVDRVLVDLRDATSLDATAIGTLLAAADAAGDLRVDLAVCNPSPALAAQLATTGFAHIRAA